MNVLKEMKGGIALSAMTSVNDGTYCMQVGKGAKLVSIGGLNFDAACTACESESFPDGESFESFVNREVPIAKKSKAYVSVGVRASTPQGYVQAAKMLEAAGADFIEIDAHCNNKAYHALGIGHYLVRNPKKLEELIRLITSNARIPIIVKCATHVMKNPQEFTKRMHAAGAKIMYYDIRKISFPFYYIHRPNYEIIREAKRVPNSFLIAVGTIKSAKKAKKFLKAGADMVAVASATLTKRDIIEKISKQL